MIEEQTSKHHWRNRRIGITGASGSLGMSLSREFRSKGAFVVGLTHNNIPENCNLNEAPNQWIQWNCGEENKLDDILEKLDILVLNHGINPGGNLNIDCLNKAIEVNALSTWRLIERFEKLIFNKKNNHQSKEIWINTSEAEIQPAFSPSYEISKRLIGQLISFKQCSLTQEEKSRLKIKKIILGPFKSKLNPIGIMSADLVANLIIKKSYYCSKLIIITPNPITYIIMPLIETTRRLYFEFFKINNEVKAKKK